MIDFSKLPRGELTKEQQAQFERRALALDDNADPPIILDRAGRRIDGPKDEK